MIKMFDIFTKLIFFFTVHTRTTSSSRLTKGTGFLYFYIIFNDMRLYLYINTVK